ncbi:MAG: DUF4926 domain-containing protein [Nitrososphaerota archaeon]
MKFQLLETVVLLRDMPEHGLRAGDLGVVEVYGPEGLEVEFVTASGRAQAVVILSPKDVRKLSPEDMFAVRPLQKVP